jgi:hypothetical protein
LILVSSYQVSISIVYIRLGVGTYGWECVSPSVPFL